MRPRHVQKTAALRFSTIGQAVFNRVPNCGVQPFPRTVSRLEFYAAFSSLSNAPSTRSIASITSLGSISRIGSVS